MLTRTVNSKPCCERCQQKGLSCCYSFSRRAGRRTTTSNSIDLASDTSTDDIPSLTSSPEASSDNVSEKGEFLDAWSPSTSHPQPQQEAFPQPISQPDLFEDDLFRMSNGVFAQPFSFPQPLLPPLADPSPMDPLPPTTFSQNGPLLGAIPPEPSAPATAIPDLLHARSPSTSSSSSSLASNPAFTSIHSELSNLSDFAASMEKKFDAVVRTRMQFRDVYSEFGVPLEEFEIDSGGDGGGGVKTPDLSELGMYYCLAELRRRLKWLGEDVGNLMGMEIDDEEDELLA